MVDAPTYTTVKDSGIDWIGVIPNSWNVRTLYQLVTQVKCKNRELQENNLLSLSYGKIKRKDINAPEGLLPASFDGYNIIESGDVVLRLTDLQNDHTSLRVGLSTERGIITSAYTTLRPISARHSKYIYYLLHAFDLKKGFYGMGSGVRQSLNYDEVKELRVVLPSDTEQEAITAYLDDQCQQIDSAIEEAKASIEEYKDWKASIIYKAVTKGINPNTEMKDSEVQWIGKVPSCWNIVRLKFASKISDEKGAYTGGYYLGLENIESRTGRIINDKNGDFKQVDSTVSTFSSGTVLFGKLRPYLAKVARPKEDGQCSTEILVIFPDKAVDCDYLYWLLLNPKFIDNVNSSTFGTKMPRANWSYIGNISIPVPPLECQLQIANQLDSMSEKIDALVDEKQSLISDLESYKRSLIYEAVTGKRKVV